MDLLLHTIVLEPARWTPARVSMPLAGLMPAVAAAGFARLEIYEPHLALAPDEGALAGQMAALGLAPVVLSSYLDLSPAFNPDEGFAAQAAALLARMDRFGFRKVRLFPGRSPAPERTEETIGRIADRLRGLAEARPGVEFLLETHDGSLADDPACVVRLIEACGRLNVGVLWQPTVFEPEAARAQFETQRAHVRHLHLQNRDAGGGFATLAEGVIGWPELLASAGPGVGATLEFVPVGVCPPERFDLEACLRQAAGEMRWVDREAARS